MAFYLLISSCGLAFNVHYCGETVASISSVFKTEEPCGTEIHQEEESCCRASSENHEGCCSDETIQADFDDVVIKQISFDFDFLSVLQTVDYPFFTHRAELIKEQLFDYYCNANAPPLYQLYSQFVFYA